MKALSLQPYWATQVFEGKKTVECRTWKTDYRGWLLICSSNNNKIPGTICGRGLIVAHLADIVPFEEKHLEPACMTEMPDTPCYAWIFDGFEDILPFKVKGKLHLFDVDDDLISYVNFEGETEEEQEEDCVKYLDNIIAPMQYRHTDPPDWQYDKDYIKRFLDDFETDESIFEFNPLTI